MKQLSVCGLVLPLLLAAAACGVASSPELESASRPDEDPAPGSAITPDNPDSPNQAKGTSPSADIPSASEDASVPDLCEDANTQQAMNQCAYQRYQAADAERTLAYQSLQAQVSDDGEQALSAAQQTWIAYRDLDCNFARQQYEGGSIVPLIYNNCLEDHTKLRTAELQQPAPPQMDYAAADAELNQAYQALLEVLSPERQEDIVDIQLAWIDYRDRSCTFESQHHPDGIAEAQCLSRLSEIRTDQLRQTTEQRSL